MMTATLTRPTKRIIAIAKRIENPEWREYVYLYNGYYHDDPRYRFNESAIEALLGPEPNRWIEEMEVDLGYSQDDASSRGQ